MVETKKISNDMCETACEKELSGIDMIEGDISNDQADLSYLRDLILEIEKKLELPEIDSNENKVASDFKNVFFRLSSRLNWTKVEISSLNVRLCRIRDTLN